MSAPDLQPDEPTGPCHTAWVWLAVAVAAGAVAGAVLWAKQTKRAASADLDLVLEMCDRAAAQLEQSLSA